MDPQGMLFTVPIAGVLALLYAYARSASIAKKDGGNETMLEISGHIKEGAMAFLGREYKVLSIFVIAVTVLLVLAYSGSAQSHALVGLSFVCGATCSALAGFFGMRVATTANVRTTNAAQKGLAGALEIAFGGGAVMGMSVVGLAVLGLSLLFIAYTRFFGAAGPGAALDQTLSVLSGFSLGASSIALFARVGGGIYTKAADVGADLVGKVEAGIPEDDPRNPAVIADNVGDNVGDVAGMGADLFESFVGAIVGAMVLGALQSAAHVMLPLYIAGAGIIVSIIGTFFVRTKEGGNPQAALNIGTFGAAIIMVGVMFVLCRILLPSVATAALPTTAIGAFGATAVGLIAGVLIGLITEYYTSESRSPVHGIAEKSTTGAATNIIGGLGLGLRSVAAPIVVLGLAILLSHKLGGGLYGIAMAALGMLSTTGIQLAVDAYGPIADNAGGIAEMAGLEKNVRERTDKLDAVGNTTAAIGKGFAIGSAALTALALFSAFQTKAGITSIDLSEPKIMVGLLFGAMVPFLFSSFAMEAVGRAANQMIEEVRRQFKSIPGLLEGKATADYKTCVDISTAAAIREMIVPGLLAVVIPVAVGFYDAHMLAGLLAGVTASGVLLALFMANAGGAWDNAKKHIESGHFGGKGSDTHKAAVVGDTVGDPFKDTAGPALNILIKLMSVVALVIAPLIAIAS
ncbi:MAG: sodium-translocating pyrophosphatase [Gemmatimonadetes bacterium]|nr:sodium-translocating pyrophosphatase [Gemmatimonadota bacterium]